MKKTIGILAHVDAGKTTFAEQLLYHTNTIRKRGRVDHKDTFLDNHYIEQERGITVFSEQGLMKYNGNDYYLIDTPGHVDFSPEMERTIMVMDYAVIIISAVEGIESHTETVWHLLRKHKIPTIFFINKVDRIGSDVEGVINEIKDNFTEDVLDITTSYNNGEMSEELIEYISLYDDSLLEKYMNDQFDQQLWTQSMKNLIKQNQIHICCSGSALLDIGIADFLEKLDELTFTNFNENEKFQGRVFKIRHDKNGIRETYIKILKGSLKVREEFSCDGEIEKITSIREYNGNKFSTKEVGSAGEIIALSGLSKFLPGDGIGALSDKYYFELIPTLKSNVVYDATLSIKEVLNCFMILEAEDPSLNVYYEEVFKEIHINVMGVIQLEVLKELVKERFNLEVCFEEPKIIYKETIIDEVNGCGHFEPLRHYAEVYINLKPGERNKGITFKSECHIDNLATNFQNLIMQHVFEREHNGILIGAPLTDINITLINGKAHNKHTNGGDFREATYRAIRQGISKTKNILLEPYYRFKIKVHSDCIGRVLADIQMLHGSFEAPKIIKDKAIIIGKAPVSTFMNYSTQLLSFTSGKGVISLVFDGYYECHNEEEAISLNNYDENSDPLYTSSSIFCSKGKGYCVNSDEVENHMHCLK